MTDHKGRILAATETDGVNATLLTRPDEKAPFKKVLTTNFREHLGPQFYTFDNKDLYAASNIGRDKQAIVTIDPATAKETGMIYRKPGRRCRWARLFEEAQSSDSTPVTRPGRKQRKYLDPQTEKMFTTLEEKLPGYQVDVVGERSRRKSSSSSRRQRSHTWLALSFQREERRADETGRGRAVAESRSARADEADRIQEPRWPNDSWLSHAAGRTRGEESAGGG